MKIGDILTGDQLDGLPVGSVVVHDEPGSAFNTVTRAENGYSWYSQRRSGAGHHDYYDLGEIVVGDWTLVHLPAVPALKVGDVIATLAQAKALPVGTVAVDDDDDDHKVAPVVKVGANMWMYYGGAGTAESGDDLTPMDHRILHIPARADAGAIRTAA